MPQCDTSSQLLWGRNFLAHLADMLEYPPSRLVPALLALCLFLAAPAPDSALAAGTGSTPAAAQKQAAQAIDQDWRALLARTYASPEERARNLELARALFMAEMRPALVLAGIGTAAEFAEEEAGNSYYNDSYRDNDIKDSSRITAGLIWELYPFAVTQQRLTDGMLDTGLSPKLRANRFSGSLRNILDTLSAISGISERHGERVNLENTRSAMRFWQLGPELTLTGKYNKPEPAGEKERALFAQQKAFAGQWLTVLLDAYDEEAPPAHLAAMEARGLVPHKPWADYSDNELPSWNLSGGSHNYFQERSFPDMIRFVWEKRADKAVMAMAQHFAEDKSIIPETRWWLISASSNYPGLKAEDYQRIAPYLDGIRSMDDCWASFSHMYRYALSFGGCEGRGFDAIKAERMRATRFDSGSEKGPGILLRKLDAAPSFPLDKTLYMLFESSRSGTEFYEPGDDTLPVFTRDVLFFMKSGPRLLQLDGKELREAARRSGAGAQAGTNPAGARQGKGHAELLQWYIEQGAATGNCLVFTSPKQAAEIAALLESWFLLIHECPENGPQPMFYFALSGNLMHTALPRVKGRAAALLMAPMERMWFLRHTPEGPEWYEASAEKGLPAIKREKTPPVIMFDAALVSALRDTYARESGIRLIYKMRERFPPSISRSLKEDLEYVQAESARLRKSIRELGQKPLKDYEQDGIIEIIWRIRDRDDQAALSAELFDALKDRSELRTTRERLDKMLNDEDQNRRKAAQQGEQP
ncbi:hypothetical protein LJC59_07770 [Desulfovibrio sp. OttesenSCG-928-A18]|nr:hypothetical protein [Desulfovibrio sp. OttesenSCG-928-A18]